MGWWPIWEGKIVIGGDERGEGGVAKWYCRIVDVRDWFVYPLPRVTERGVPGARGRVVLYLCGLWAGRKCERPLKWIYT